MKITNLEDVAKVQVTLEGAQDTWKQVPIAAADGTPNLSMRLFTIDPHGHTPYHRHPYEHLNYIVRGTGALVTETGEERPVKAGDFALVLPNETHQYRNSSDNEPLMMICAVPKEYE